MDTSRGGPLEDLVHWRGDLAALVQAIQQSEAKGPVTFTRCHAAAAAKKVATGLGRPDELVDWAQAVHFEDEIEIEDGHEDLLTQFLFQVSTPELFEPITVRFCQRWMHIIQASTRGGLRDTCTLPWPVACLSMAAEQPSTGARPL